VNEIVKNFEFEGKGLRTIAKDGEMWWVAQDICHILCIKNSRQALSRLDEDEKGVILNDTLGGSQEISIVNESGLYNLIFSSRKKEFKDFKRWVYREVLPSIRKTGRYDVKDFRSAVLAEVKIQLPQAVDAEMDIRVPVIETKAALLYANGRRRKELTDRLEIQRFAENILKTVSKYKKISEDDLFDELFFIKGVDRADALCYLFEKEKIDHKRILDKEYLFLFDDIETRHKLRQIMIGEIMNDDFDKEEKSNA
jgi:prophage antirepressor-like protein